MKTNRVVGVLALALFLVAGNALASKRMYKGPTYNHHGVVINTTQIKNDGKKIWFEILVINQSGKTLTIDRNQLTAKLPDGTIVSRERGTFAKWGSQAAYVVVPGGSHDIKIEFPVPGTELINVALQLHGFMIDNKPVNMPDFVATPM
jgi:hypothetical protein